MSVSKSEQLFLNQLQLQKLQVFRTEEVRLFWGSPENTDNALSRLLRKQQIVRLSRGIYALVDFPTLVGSNRFTQYSLIASHLVPDAVLAYQTAMCVYDRALTANSNTTWFIQTTHRKKEVSILDVKYVFIQAKPVQFFDIRSENLESGHRIAVTGIEKTIADGANHPEYIGGIPNLVQFMSTFSQKIDWLHLQQAALTMQNGAILKRLGYLIDRYQINIPERKNYLNRIQASLTQGVVLLDPKKGERGHIHSRWEIEDNVFDCKGGAG